MPTKWEMLVFPRWVQQTPTQQPTDQQQCTQPMFTQQGYVHQQLMFAQQPYAHQQPMFAMMPWGNQGDYGYEQVIEGSNQSYGGSGGRGGNRGPFKGHCFMCDNTGHRGRVQPTGAKWQHMSKVWWKGPLSAAVSKHKPAQ